MGAVMSKRRADPVELVLLLSEVLADASDIAALACETLPKEVTTDVYTDKGNVTAVPESLSSGMRPESKATAVFCVLLSSSNGDAKTFVSDEANFPILLASVRSIMAPAEDNDATMLARRLLRDASCLVLIVSFLLVSIGEFKMSAYTSVFWATASASPLDSAAASAEVRAAVTYSSLAVVSIGGSSTVTNVDACA